MKAHPFAEEWPNATPDEFNDMVADMEEHGFNARFPIVVYKGRILDGRTRDAAARKAGIKAKYVQFKGDDAAAREFCRIANLNRRHLTMDQKKAMREARMQRIAEHRVEGKSIRQIAEEESVSTMQVVRDIEKSGQVLPPVTPDGEIAKTTGKDGKSYDSTRATILCGRCQRVGAPVAGCPMCKEERAAHKTGRDAGSHEPKRKKGAKGGAVGFDWKAFFTIYGQLIRQVSQFGRLYGCTESGEGERLRNLLGQFHDGFRAWTETVSRMPAPKR